MTMLAPTLQAFFTDRLARQRQASPRTVAAYRDTFRLLLAFVQRQIGKAPFALGFEHLEATVIVAFLNHIEADRHNSPRTRNARLAAIRSFFRYAAYAEFGIRLSCHRYDGVLVKTLVNHILCGVAYCCSDMRTQRGPRGQFSSLYGTTTLRLTPEFPYPPGGPRYERLVFDANDQLIVPLNEWYLLMKGIGAARTRDTYLAVLRPWFGFLANHGYQWNARPEAVREYTRLFLVEAGCALRTGRVEGWFIQATNRSPISANGLHLLIAALRSFYTVMARGVFDSQDQRYHPLYAFDNPMYSKVLVAWRSEHRKWIRNAGEQEHDDIRY